MSSEIRIGFRAVDGLQLRYADSDGSASQYVVLTSPWLESLHAFDRMWPRLSGTARLLAIDLPGFGRSERRGDLLSPIAMSEFLIRILDEWNIADPRLACLPACLKIKLFMPNGRGCGGSSPRARPRG